MSEPTTDNSLLQEFRDDLHPPEVSFGRCAVTGEWGKCVVLDLGSLAFEHPDVDKGVEYDPKTKKVTFNNFKPIIHQSQVTLSEPGLEKVLAWLRDQQNPIPSVTPDLVYQWLVRYHDGNIFSQFMMNDAYQEIENSSRDIDFDRIAQAEILPRDLSDTTLPRYSLDLRTGSFYRNGSCIDGEIEYEGKFDPTTHKLAYKRKVMHTFGSNIKPGTMTRNITAASSAVQQLFGWGIEGGNCLLRESNDVCCVISIDDKGMWRPYKQVVD